MLKPLARASQYDVNENLFDIASLNPGSHRTAGGGSEACLGPGAQPMNVSSQAKQ
jgi:hypothetical protein